jgi:CBS domain-containing protein
MTRVDELMTRDVAACSPSDSLNTAAKIMWDRDCGCVPVIDERSHVVGMLTDRDICMAAYLNDRPLSMLRVADSMSRDVHQCGATDALDIAERMMCVHQIRRLPVVDDEGSLVGVLSINDLVVTGKRDGRRRRSLPAEHIEATLAAVSQPRAGRVASMSSAM